MLEQVGQIFSTAIDALPRAAKKALSRENLATLGEVMLAASAGLGSQVAAQQLLDIYGRKLAKREQERQAEELAKGLELLAMTQNERLSREDALSLARAFGPEAAKLLLPHHVKTRTGLMRLPSPILGGEPTPVGPQTPLAETTMGLPSGTLGNIATSLAMREAAEKGETFRPESAWLKIPEALGLQTEMRAAERALAGRGQAQLSPRDRFLEKSAAELVQAGRAWVDERGNPPSPQVLQASTVRAMFESGYRLLGAADIKKLKAARSGLAMTTQLARAIALAELTGWLVPMTARTPYERTVERAKLKALAAITQDPTVQLLRVAKSETIGLGRGVFDEIGMRAIAAFEGLMSLVEPGESDYASAYVNLQNIDNLARKTISDILGAPVTIEDLPGAAWLPPPSQMIKPQGRALLAKALEYVNRKTIESPDIQAQRQAIPQLALAEDSAVRYWLESMAGKRSLPQPGAAPVPMPAPQPTQPLTEEQRQRVLDIIRQLQTQRHSP